MRLKLSASEWFGAFHTPNYYVGNELRYLSVFSENLEREFNEHLTIVIGDVSSTAHTRNMDKRD